VYLYFRRPQRQDPRQAMYHAFEALQDVLDGDLDIEEATRIEAQLAIAKNPDRDESRGHSYGIVSLAEAISHFLQMEKQHLSTAEPGLWKRMTTLTMSCFGHPLPPQARLARTNAIVQVFNNQVSCFTR